MPALLTSPDDLVSLGSFRVPESRTAEFRAPVPVDRGEFQFVDVSLEEDDDDASHSRRSILSAPTQAGGSGGQIEERR